MLKVSIITVTYNSAETIADTIESVLKQSYKNIEYWIIDGMSKDNTLEIIESYKEKFKGRLHWISEKDKGIYDAMNKGIDRCSGDVVGILNSDDFFTDSMVIEKMVEAFDDDVDALYGDVHFVKFVLDVMKILLSMIFLIKTIIYYFVNYVIIVIILNVYLLL